MQEQTQGIKVGKIGISLMTTLLPFVISSCSVVAEVFKAGVGFGVSVVIVAILVVVFMIWRPGKQKSSPSESE